MCVCVCVCSLQIFQWLVSTKQFSSTGVYSCKHHVGIPMHDYHICIFACLCFRCVCMLDLPAGRGTAGCTACGRGHGGEQPACSDACAGSAASPSPWRLHLPGAAVGYRPDRAPPAPSGYWRLRPRSMWCCCRIAKAPAQNEEKITGLGRRSKILLESSTDGKDRLPFSPVSRSQRSLSEALWCGCSAETHVVSHMAHQSALWWGSGTGSWPSWA